MSWKLNDSSKIARQPSGFVGELRRHQLAMFHRALSIERQESDSAFGFFADKAGTGKTAVVISLVLADKQIGDNKRKTFIVVPQNIINQWIEEIDKFSGGALRVKNIQYEDIINIESNGNLKSLRKYDIIIATVDYFGSIMTSLSGNGNSIYRIVYDEIDTMDSQIEALKTKKDAIEKHKKRLIKKNETLREKEIIDFVPPAVDKGIKNRITWFVSASIYRLIDDQDGFCFLGKQIPNNELSKLFIKCDNNFIDKNLPVIEEEEEEIYECECIADDYSDFLSVEQIDSINSMSYDEINIKNRKKVPNNDLELMTMLVEEYYNNMYDLEDSIHDIEKKMDAFGVDEEEEPNHPLVMSLNYNLKDHEFNKKIAMSLHAVKCAETECPDKLACTLEHMRKLNDQVKPNTKMVVLNEELKKIFSENKNSKVLIFSDFQGSFKHLPGMIERLNLKYEDLCKGTPELINNAIGRYKNSDTNILLIKSSSDACGLNLQITTHLLFIHRTEESLRDQVIGRAVRQGRTGVLKVISFYNKNENIDDDEED